VVEEEEEEEVEEEWGGIRRGPCRSSEGEISI
jgi:hypothetical protein